MSPDSIRTRAERRRKDQSQSELFDNERTETVLIARSSLAILGSWVQVCLLNLYKWRSLYGPLTLASPTSIKITLAWIHFSFPGGNTCRLRPFHHSTLRVYQRRLFVSRFAIITFLDEFLFSSSNTFRGQYTYIVLLPKCDKRFPSTCHIVQFRAFRAVARTKDMLQALLAASAVV